eukprot:g23826.t1
MQPRYYQSSEGTAVQARAREDSARKRLTISSGSNSLVKLSGSGGHAPITRLKTATSARNIIRYRFIEEAMPRGQKKQPQKNWAKNWLEMGAEKNIRTTNMDENKLLLQQIYEGERKLGCAINRKVVPNGTNEIPTRRSPVNYEAFEVRRSLYD